jgi:hypothetical protein
MNSIVRGRLANGELMLALTQIVMAITAFRAVSGHAALGWRIAMNTETDRDLTTEDQEQLSGGLFFRDDLSGEFADQFLHNPAAILSWPREPKSAGVRHRYIR